MALLTRPLDSSFQVADVVPTTYTARVIAFDFPSSWAVQEPYSEADALRLESDMREWLAPVLTTPALHKRFLAANAAGYGGHARIVGGRGGHYDAAVLVTKFVVLFTIWDDFIETASDPSSHIAAIKRMVDGKRDPHAQGFLALWQDYIAHAERLHRGPSVERFRRAFHAWLDSILEELILAHDDDVDLATLWRVRKTSMSTYLLLVHVEAISGVSLPDKILQRNEMQQIFDHLAVDHRLLNELVSLPKDILGQEAGNVLLATMQTKRWDIQTTLNDAMQQHKACVAGVDALQKKLKVVAGSLKGDLTRFLDFTRHLILGFEEWHANAKRYSKVKIIDHKSETFYTFRVQVHDSNQHDNVE
ncbi:Aste57867_814 [Aphanomyces stellatus]|uniref:Terpene synthase n=1 Tax=Aphanomyces stellatus TaxID=120398 RepID=A0A485K3V5_9STRA|nr:hypothetical protein As57867_000813 [Aphanomyces stellatus]VFT78038.1 Aste57867_814 [Aphanomyces stellatus]